MPDKGSCLDLVWMNLNPWLFLGCRCVRGSDVELALDLVPNLLAGFHVVGRFKQRTGVFGDVLQVADQSGRIRIFGKKGLKTGIVADTAGPGRKELRKTF